jgi:fucose permease
MRLYLNDLYDLDIFLAALNDIVMPILIPGYELTNDSASVVLLRICVILLFFLLACCMAWLNLHVCSLSNWLVYQFYILIAYR